MVERIEEFSRAFYIRILITLLRAESWPNYVPKIPPQNTINLGVRIQQLNGDHGDTSIQSLAPLIPKDFHSAGSGSTESTVHTLSTVSHRTIKARSQFAIVCGSFHLAFSRGSLFHITFFIPHQKVEKSFLRASHVSSSFIILESRLFFHLKLSVVQNCRYWMDFTSFPFIPLFSHFLSRTQTKRLSNVWQNDYWL